VRRRLLVVSTTLVGLLLVALMAPLVTTFAGDRTQDLFSSRLGDVTRFSVIAQGALESGDVEELSTDLERYVEVFGGSVVVTNANREVVASSGPEVDSSSPEVIAAIEQALSGSASTPPSTAWPWAEDAVVIGTPVGRDAQVLGAVVAVAPTASVQGRVTNVLIWLLLGGLATMLLTAYGVVSPFIGWVLRPVRDLDGAARRLADGDLGYRAHQTGPAELRDLARSFNTMADNVETSQQQQRDLVADAAHQLGNPLTALRLRVENLGSVGVAVHEVDIVLEETDRLNRIVEALLDLSQVGAHQVTLERVDVAEHARRRCEMWSPMFARLVVLTPASAPALAGADIVDVALDALLDNAAKFAPGAAVEVTVRVSGDTDGRVLLRVRDHGAGLDAEDVGKVGARFFRGRQHQNVAGTGLGLAIVRARLDDLGGTLEAGLAPGGGLQVDVLLPAFRDGAPGSSARSPDGGQAAT